MYHLLNPSKEPAPQRHSSFVCELSVQEYPMTQHRGSPTVGVPMIPPATLIAPNSVIPPGAGDPINTDIADHLRPAARDSTLKSKGGAAPLAG